jgi:Helix-turn-helix domain
MEAIRMNKLAYSIPDLRDVVGLSKTKAFEEIASGKLRARKIGRRTVVLAEDLVDYLESLPESVQSKEAK